VPIVGDFKFEWYADMNMDGGRIHLGRKEDESAYYKYKTIKGNILTFCEAKGRCFFGVSDCRI
jgi:hypothetical protein